MPYTIKQLTMAWTAVHNGIAPDAETLAALQLRTNASFSDADAMGYVLNSGDDSTAVALLTYQFFTGKAPTQGGVAYLVHSDANPNDLSDPYYAKFNIENRYVNFASNLGVNGAGASDFAAKYGAMSFSDYVASLYETIIGSTYAKAAGIDVAAALKYLVSTRDALLATAKGSGMVTDGMTPAQVDLALKAAMAGLLIAESVKADVGIYAASANNFMLAMTQGKAVYGGDLTTTYGPTSGLGSDGTGKTINTPPSVYDLPGGPTKPPVVTVPDPDPSLQFALTAQNDTFTGDVGDDTFTATDTTFNAGDILKGAGGNDSLTLTAATGGTYTVPGATVTGIETATISNNSLLVADVSGWTGLTRLNATAVYGLNVAATASIDVVANISNQAHHSETITNAHDVTLNVTGAGLGNINLSGITGAIVITRATALANFAAGGVTVHGGTTVDITQTATNTSGTAIMSQVNVYGGADTTSVKVKAPATSGTVTAQDVYVQDVNAYSSTLAGKITSVEVDGYRDLQIDANSLTTLKVAHGGNVTIENGSLSTPVATTLNLTVNDLNSSISDQGVYQTLNLVGGAEDSYLYFTLNALKTLAVSGSGSVSINSLTAPDLQTITVTGSGGTYVYAAGLASLATLNGATATGSITATVDATVTAITTGSGADSIRFDGTSITKAVDAGAGDDTVTLGYGAATPVATITGGLGTDTLAMWADDAASASGSSAFAGKVTGFERLLLSTSTTNATVDLAMLGGYHYVLLDNSAGKVTLNGLASGDTVVMQAELAVTTIGSTAFGNASDSFNLKILSTSSGDFGDVGTTGVETFNIVMDNTSATPVGGYLNSLHLLDTATKVITMSGDNGVRLRTESTALTTVDASGLTLGDFRWTAGALTQAATIKGSATGENIVNFAAATGGTITYEGGSGNENINATNGLATNIIHLGGGVNYFIGNAASVTAGSGDDYIRVDNAGATIDAGAGSNRVLINGADGSTITTGTGDDQVFVNGGRNVIDVGSGADYVEISTAAGTSATVFTEITGIGVGDKVFIVSNHAAVMGAELTGQTTLAGYLALANDVAGTTNTLHWFKLGSDIYILSDVSDATTFTAGADSVVKLVGAGSLNVSAATVTNGLITF